MDETISLHVNIVISSEEMFDIRFLFLYVVIIEQKKKTIKPQTLNMCDIYVQ